MEEKHVIDVRNYGNKAPIKLARELIYRGMEDNKKVQNEGKAGNVQNKDVNAEIRATLDAKKQPETVETEGRKQKVSASYTVRAFGENIKKLGEMGFIDKTDEERLLEIRGRIAESYMRKELGI